MRDNKIRSGLTQFLLRFSSQGKRIDLLYHRVIPLDCLCDVGEDGIAPSVNVKGFFILWRYHGMTERGDIYDKGFDIGIDRRTVFEQVTIKRAATILLLVCDYNDLLDMLALSCESSDGCACICAATGSDLLRLAQNAIMT